MPIVNGEHRWFTACASDQGANLSTRLRAFLLDVASIDSGSDVPGSPFEFDGEYVRASLVFGLALVGSYADLVSDCLEDGGLHLDAVFGFVRALAVLRSWSPEQCAMVQDCFDWITEGLQA